MLDCALRLADKCFYTGNPCPRRNLGHGHGTSACCFRTTTIRFRRPFWKTALIGRHPHLPPLAWESPADAALAGRALDDVHLAELSGRSVTTLSGGERQRLAVATLLTQDPQVWLLDEPISHLDLHHQIALLNLLQNRLIQNQGTALMTLHDVKSGSTLL